MMNYYQELIDGLRICVKYKKAEEAPCNAEFAADAIEQLVKERDAAIADFTIYIKHMEDGRKAFSCEFCNEENCDDCKHCSNFEWRGVRSEENVR